MLTTVLNSVHSRTTASEATRWGQLIFGIICMVMIANLQYGWTLFVKSDRSEISLGTGGYPSGIYDLRAHGNVANGWVSLGRFMLEAASF